MDSKSLNLLIASQIETVDFLNKKADSETEYLHKLLKLQEEKRNFKTKFRIKEISNADFCDYCKHSLASGSKVIEVRGIDDIYCSLVCLKRSQ